MFGVEVLVNVKMAEEYWYVLYIALWRVEKEMWEDVLIVAVYQDVLAYSVTCVARPKVCNDRRRLVGKVFIVT